MAHQVYINAANRASIAYQGAKPWHGLGQSMPTTATMEMWREACGFDWEIVTTPVEYRDLDGNLLKMEDRRVLFRSDTGAALSVMSDRYQVVQPAQVLDFFRDVCESQRWTMETAGVLRGGAQYWALAKAGLDAYVAGTDEHQMYMLLATSADGSLATLAQATDIRVVCANTLGFALNNTKGQSLRIRHNTAFDEKQIKRELGMVDMEQSWNCFISTMKALQSVEIDRNQATRFFSDLLRPSKDRQAVAGRPDLHAESLSDLLKAPAIHTANPIRVGDKDKDRAIRGLAELESSYYTAPGACPGTAYGLLQGVTHFIDHSRGKSTDQRLSSAWFGQGAAIKQQAVNTALAMA
jgi:phage/plasmid-like protein (TIGR03299 family)